MLTLNFDLSILIVFVITFIILQTRNVWLFNKRKEWISIYYSFYFDKLHRFGEIDKNLPDALSYLESPYKTLLKVWNWNFERCILNKKILTEITKYMIEYNFHIYKNPENNKKERMLDRTHTYFKNEIKNKRYETTFFGKPIKLYETMTDDDIAKIII
jgi:hypothetical protein